MRELDDKVALITGAGSGQGRAAACLFAANGARIAVVDKNAAGARETLALVEEQGGTANVPMGRLGEAGDICDAVEFLLGEGSRYISGTVLPVDGAMAARRRY